MSKLSTTLWNYLLLFSQVSNHDKKIMFFFILIIVLKISIHTNALTFDKINEQNRVIVDCEQILRLKFNVTVHLILLN